MVGFLFFFVSPFLPSESAMLLLNLVVLGTGAQSVIMNRDIRRSDNSNKYEGVRQQYIIKY